MLLREYMELDADVFFEDLLDFKDERDKRKGGAGTFTSTDPRPVVDGEPVPAPHIPRLWRNATELDNLTDIDEFRRFTTRSRADIGAQARFERENKPEEQWERFEPRW